MDKSNLKKISDVVWEIPTSAKQGMNAPARIIASEKILNDMDPGVFEQTTNVACLPGIQKYAFCMPDGHWGYGFPIGGVAAFSEENGIISPGGVGYDINCGVRILRTNLNYKDVKPKLRELIDALFKNVPCGLGAGGAVKVDKKTLDEVMTRGVDWCIENGFGWKQDSEHCEDYGSIKGADPKKVSDKARERGYDQLGTLGSGNHFLEVQAVDEIFEPEIAKAMGIFEKGQIVVMIHCGSRGFGHQIASEYIRIMDSAVRKYGIKIKDRELVCAPINSQEGKDYFSAMCCAANNSFANRQVIMHLTRKSFEQVFKQPAEKMEMDLIYDLCHNIAKKEEHNIDGNKKTVMVHRKGAARAMPAGHPSVPSAYKKIGQPVIIPGAMGTESYLLVGLPGAEETFFSSCHGAGRAMSRTAAMKKFRGDSLKKELESRGMAIRAKSMEGLAEEAAGAYKNVTEVIQAIESAKICKAIVKVQSIATMKG